MCVDLTFDHFTPLTPFIKFQKSLELPPPTPPLSRLPLFLGHSPVSSPLQFLLHPCVSVSVSCFSLRVSLVECSGCRVKVVCRVSRSPGYSTRSLLLPLWPSACLAPSSRDGPWKTTQGGRTPTSHSSANGKQATEEKKRKQKSA